MAAHEIGPHRVLHVSNLFVCQIRIRMQRKQKTQGEQIHNQVQEFHFFLQTLETPFCFLILYLSAHVHSSHLCPEAFCLKPSAFADC